MAIFLFFEILLASMRTTYEFYIWMIFAHVNFECLQNSEKYFLSYRRGYQDKVQSEV